MFEEENVESAEQVFQPEQERELADTVYRTLSIKEVNDLPDELPSKWDRIQQNIDEMQAENAKFDSSDGAAVMMMRTSKDAEAALAGRTDIYGSFRTSQFSNPKSNYYRTKQLTKDLAHLGSTEQAVADMVNLWKARRADSEVLSPEEALAMSREQGVELKFDKPTTKGELQYKIQRELYRRELESELALFKQTGDYTSMQKLLLLGSSISGSVGLLEPLAIGALLAGSVPALAGGMVALASRAGSVYRGVKMAQRMMLAEKVARTTANSTAKIAQAAKTARTIRFNLDKSNLATKIAYDSFRFGKTVGNRASLASVTIPFAIDGAISSTPSALIKYQASKELGNGDYTMKDAILEICLGTSISAALPSVGTYVLKPTLGAGKKAFNYLTDTLHAAKNKKEMEALAKSQELVIEQAEKEGIELTQQLEEIHKIASGEAKMNPQTIQNNLEIAKANLTDEEFMTLINAYINAFKNGTSLNVIDSLPFRGKFYSNLPGMLDLTQQLAKNEATMDDFFHVLHEMNIPLEYNKVRELPLVDRLKSGSVGVGIKIAGEGGALGRTFAHGLSEDEARKFIYNVYMARMCDTEGIELEASIRAGLEAEEQIAHLEKIKLHIDNIIRIYEMINSENTLAKDTGRPAPYPYKKQHIYPSARTGDPISLEKAVFELAEMILPETERADLDYRQILQEANDLFAQTGRGTLSAEEKATIEALDKQYQETLEGLVAILGERTPSKQDGNMYFNPIGVEGSADKAALFKQLSADFEQMITENKALLNSDRIFLENMDNPESIIAKLQNGEDVSEFSYSYENASAKALDMQNMLKSEEASMSRLIRAKDAVAAYEKTSVKENLQQILDIIMRETTTGARIAKGYMLDIQQTIITAEKFLTGNFGEMRNAFLKEIQSNEFLAKIATQNGNMTEASLARVITEEGQTFRSILKRSIISNVTGEFPLGTFGKKLDEAIDVAVDNFTTMLREDPEGGLAKFTEKINIDFSETGDEIATKVVDLEKQKQTFDIVLKPLLQSIGKEVADLQTQLLHTQARTYDLWDRCLKTPARMSEVILGDITMTYLPTKGASMSIENLAGFKVEFQNFLKAMDLSDQAERGTEPLREWAFRPENMEEIQEAIIDRWAFISGKMTPEQQLKYDPNTQAGRVAIAYLDNLASMKANLYNIGSGKQRLVSFQDPSKLSRAYEYLQRKVWGGNMHKAVKELATDIDPEYANIAKAMRRLLPVLSTKEDEGISNLVIHWLEQLDLDKHFNTRASIKPSLNEVRDALLTGSIPGQGPAMERLIKKYSLPDIEKAIIAITDGFMGNEEKLGLIQRLGLGTGRISADKAKQSAKYLDDLNETLFYKSLDAEKADLKSFGYDNMKSWYESDMGRAKKAYAILSKAGSEPFQFYMSMMDIARTYANKVAPLKHGIKNASILQESVNSPTWERSLIFNVNNVCGTYSVPAGQGVKIAQLLVRVLSTPMLMKAGIKSITDYNYQFQDMVTMGLASGSDIQTRVDVVKRLARCFADRDMRNRLYLTQTMNTNMLYEKMLNVPMSQVKLGEAGRKAGIQGIGQLNEYASNTSKAETLVKGYTDFLLNKFAWIGPMTELNRSNAALNIMQSVAKFAKEGNTWNQIAGKNKRLIQSLERFGINEYEWDNVFSKDAIMKMDDYINKYHGTNITHFEDHEMFFPDLLSELSDDRVAELLRAQGRPVSEANIQSYRQLLTDKASMLVNVSADEMTSIPTSRIQGALYAGHDPNTWAGFGIGTLLQFQTFGAAVNYYHWGRRIATHMSEGDEVFNKFLMSVAWQSAAPDMAGLIGEMALAQFIINEAINEIAGNNRRIVNEEGAFVPEALVDKITRAFTDQLGIFASAADAIMTGVTQPFGKGGGISLAVLPAGSAAIKKAQRLYDAATKKSVEGHRAQAITAALVENTAEQLGISNHPLTQAIWAMMIGDWLVQAQKGTSYDRYMRQRRKNGYGPSLLQYGVEGVKELFTN